MERGMKKWAPYKTLTEQYSCLAKLRKDKEKIEKPLISNERAQEINEILTSYQGEQLKIKFYKRGEIFEIISVILKIDIINKVLKLPEKIRISLKDLINLEKI